MGGAGGLENERLNRFFNQSSGDRGLVPAFPAGGGGGCGGDPVHSCSRATPPGP